MKCDLQMNLNERQIDMIKNYPDHLAEWIKRRTSSRREKNLAAFLAVSDDVRAALNAGYAVKTVWANMRECERIEIGYEVFLHYVNRVIRHPQADQISASTTDDLPQPGETNHKTRGTIATPATPTTKPADPLGFKFDATPNREELL